MRSPAAAAVESQQPAGVSSPVMRDDVGIGKQAGLPGTSAEMRVGSPVWTEGIEKFDIL